MKAALIYQYGSPDVFRIEEIKKPVIKNHEVLVKVHAASVNPVDWKQRQGWHRLFLKAKFPIVVGYDVSGEVVECGTDVKDFHIGDQVYARLTRRFGGAFAEYAAASEETLAIKPDNISWEQAAAVPLAGITALQALRDKCRLKKGERIMVIGAAGGVGHFALQIAKQMGATATAVCSGRHQKMMEELKPDFYIDYTMEDFKLQKEKYDVIFDAAGVESFISTGHLLARGGRYLTTLPRPKIVIHKLMAFFKSRKVKSLLMKSKGDDLRILSELISKNQLKIFIDSIFPLDKIADAHRRAEEYATEGKIVIQVPR